LGRSEKDSGREEEQRLLRIINQMNNVWPPEVKKDNQLPRMETELQQIKRLISNGRFENKRHTDIGILDRQ
jgi:hypothetical protein